MKEVVVGERGGGDRVAALPAANQVEEGVDAAARDFLAGMTDRYAVNLFETLYIPKPWVGPIDLVDGQ